MTLVWYAAYGSNTDEARFREYLAGCREAVEPLASRPLTIDLPLYFAGRGRAEGRWGLGGVAFASTARDERASTLARGWLLPAARLAEVGAQENGLPVAAAALDPSDLDHVAFPGRPYDTWVHCGDLDGVPLVTLTASTRRQPPTPPGPRYVAVVARGLRATHEMTREEVADYLAPRANLPFTTLMEWQSGGHG